MCVGSPTAGTWSSSQWRPDDEFETDNLRALTEPKGRFSSVSFADARELEHPRTRACAGVGLLSR